MANNSGSECDYCNHVEYHEDTKDTDHYVCSQSAFAKNFEDIVGLSSALASRKKSIERDDLSALRDKSKEMQDLLKQQDNLINLVNSARFSLPGDVDFPSMELDLSNIAPEFVKAIMSPRPSSCSAGNNNEWCALPQTEGMTYYGNNVCSTLHKWCVREDGKFILPLYDTSSLDLASSRILDFKIAVLEPFYSKNKLGITQKITDFGKISTENGKSSLLEMPEESSFTQEQIKARDQAKLKAENIRAQLLEVNNKIAVLTAQTNFFLRDIRLKKFEKMYKNFPLFNDKKILPCEQFKL